jgi:hypothetical protein
MPEKAIYYSSFTISDNQKNVLTVLQCYKDWVDDKMSTVIILLILLGEIHGTEFILSFSRDSVIKLNQMWRDSLTNTNMQMIAGTNLRSADKNEDWVSVWYKAVDTFKNGKIVQQYTKMTTRL